MRGGTHLLHPCNNNGNNNGNNNDNDNDIDDNNNNDNDNNDNNNNSNNNFFSSDRPNCEQSSNNLDKVPKETIEEKSSQLINASSAITLKHCRGKGRYLEVYRIAKS